MEVLNFPTIEEIKKMDLNKLHDIVFGSFEKKEFNVIYKEVAKSILAQEEITKFDIVDLLTIDIANRSYGFPFADERLHFNHTFLGYKIVPVKGFFWLIKPIVRERMFGLVDVDFSIEKISVKTNDERFENFNRVYKDVKNFYYDYSTDTYVQINKSGKNENTEEYKLREQLYSAVLERLEKENLSYLKRLETYVLYFKDTEPNNTVTFKAFFDEYFKFLDEEVDFLKFKYLMGHIDSDNYFRMKKHFNKLKEEVDEWNKKIDEAIKNGIVDKFTDYEMYHESEWYESMNVTRNKIRELFKLRDTETIRKGKTVSKDGYYDTDDKRAYANLVQIEIIRAFKDYPGSVENRLKEEADLVQALLKDGDNANENGLFTKEQLSKIESLSGAELSTYLSDTLNQLILDGVIEKSAKNTIMKEQIQKKSSR